MCDAGDEHLDYYFSRYLTLTGVAFVCCGVWAWAWCPRQWTFYILSGMRQFLSEAEAETDTLATLW